MSERRMGVTVDNRLSNIPILITWERQTVEKLVDYILVGKRIPGSNEVPIEIHWNF